MPDSELVEVLLEVANYPPAGTITKESLQYKGGTAEMTTWKRIIRVVEDELKRPGATLQAAAEAAEDAIYSQSGLPPAIMRRKHPANQPYLVELGPGNVITKVNSWSDPSQEGDDDLAGELRGRLFDKITEKAPLLRKAITGLVEDACWVPPYMAQQLIPRYTPPAPPLEYCADAQFSGVASRGEEYGWTFTPHVLQLLEYRGVKPMHSKMHACTLHGAVDAVVMAVIGKSPEEYPTWLKSAPATYAELPAKLQAVLNVDEAPGLDVNIKFLRSLVHTSIVTPPAVKAELQKYWGGLQSLGVERGEEELPDGVQPVHVAALQVLIRCVNCCSPSHAYACILCGHADCVHLHMCA